jgi:hypothetical protein
MKHFGIRRQPRQDPTFSLSIYPYRVQSLLVCVFYRVRYGKMHDDTLKLVQRRTDGHTIGSDPDVSMDRCFRGDQSTSHTHSLTSHSCPPKILLSVSLGPDDN